MSLLAEAIQTLPIQCMPDEQANGVRQQIRCVPLFCVDNVAQYMFQQTEIDQWRGVDRAYPNLAPPFREFWIEYKHPPWVLHQGAHSQAFYGTGNDLHVGALIGSIPPRPRERWRLAMLLFSGFLNRREITWNSQCEFGLDDVGRAIDESLNDPDSFSIASVPTDREMIPKLTTEFFQFLQPIFLSLSFVHCKNIHTFVRTPPPALAKRNRERGKPPMLKYHILQIEPMKKVLRQDGRIETEGLKRALHICRGHFAHYPETGPGLFGKGIHGDFWIPQHARGSVERGVVVSDFNVKAPEKEKES